MAHPLSSIPQPHYAAILTAADDARDAVTAKHGGIPLHRAAVVEGNAAYDKAIADGVECYRAITDAQIEALQIEAAIAGDKDMVETCERAAAGDLSARAECIVALRPVTEV